LYATSLKDFQQAWDKMERFFASQTAIIQYLNETYLPIAQDWATCYTNKRLNFGIRTTSPVESANRHLKTLLVSGNSDVKQAVDQSFNMVKEMKLNITEARQQQKSRLRREYLGQAWLGDTPLKITLKAMKMVTKEYRHMLGTLPSRGRPQPPPLAPCTGQFTAQFGLPCRHELLGRYNDGGLVLQKQDFHPY
jgi:hypothetical protein